MIHTAKRRGAFTRPPRDSRVSLTARRVRHLPVRQRGRLIRLVSIGDLVHATITEQEQVIEHLQHYIAG
jgi:hypothetical protein